MSDYPILVWDGLKIVQGSTFKLRVTVRSNGTPLNLTGYTALMQGRLYPEHDVVHWQASTAILTGDTAPRIVIDPLAGVLDIKLSDEATQSVTPAQGVYDLKLIPPNGEATKPLRGAYEVIAGSSR